MTGAQCFLCKHLNGLGMCEAFPDGIPEDIMSGDVSHDHPIPGQVGDYVFEAFDAPAQKGPVSPEQEQP